MNEKVSHATTKKEEYYVVRFDNKEFKVKVLDCQRHHKDYPEITSYVVTQEPNQEDRSKCIELVENEMIKRIRNT